MKQEDFYQQLSLFAEWEIPKPETKYSPKPDHVEEIVEYDEDGEEIVSELSEDHNPTLPPVIKKFKKQIQACEDCGQMVQGRTVNIKRYFQPESHWRRSCTVCRQFQDPLTGEFNLTMHQVAAIWSKIFREKDK